MSRPPAAPRSTRWTPVVGAGETIVSYSQNAEDVRLWRVFRDVENGFYVDVGAADPLVGSVTRLFYERGWFGVNVEPSPTFDALDEARSRDVNVRAAIGETEGQVSFVLTYPDLGMSTLDRSIHENVEERIDYTDEITIPQHRLETVLAEHAAGRAIHFLKIDVEGAERQVLASSDWRVFRPIVVVVEAVEPWSASPTHEQWEHILVDAGYIFAAFDGINRYYVESAQDHLIPALAYPISALDGYVPASIRGMATSTAEGLAIPADPASSSARDTNGRVRELRESLQHVRALLSEANKETAILAGEVSRLRVHEAALRMVYQSRTWQAGTIVAKAASPFLALRRTARLKRLRPERPRRAAELYVEATRRGHAWHFPRGRRRPGRQSEALDSLAEQFGRVETPLDRARAVRIAGEIERLGWTDEESLLARRLSWKQRQAIVEADAVLRLATGMEDRSVHARFGQSGDSVVVVDARCLQDPTYRSRGVGLHARGVVAATRAATAGHRLVLLTSAELAELDGETAELADRVVTTSFEVRDERVVLFVELSPMTASAAVAVPFLAAPTCATASVVYDFIPSAFPSAYLRSATEILTNRARIEALRHYDVLLPISSATEADCRRILGGRMTTTVTGVADPLHGVHPATVYSKRPFALIPVGGDPRKNASAAVAALAQQQDHDGDRVRAVIAGVLSPAQAHALKDLGIRLGLPDEAVELRGAVTERELAGLYEAAEVVLVTSFAEGFSIPVAEAVLRGAPVVASDIPAHRELLGPGAWLAPPADVEALAHAISYVRQGRTTVTARQQEALGDTSDPAGVVARTRDALGGLPTAGPDSAPARIARGRPRLALVSPWPPERSGVADYTAFTFRRVAEYADVEVYSGAPPAPDSPLSVHPITTAPYLDRRFDSVINIVGNSHFHFPMLDLMESFGGACIAHDNRMIEAYRYYRGDPHTAQMLSTELRAVRPEEIGDFLLDLDRLPSIGYGLIARQASPLIVHGRALADRVRSETGVEAVVVPFIPYNVPPGPIAGSDRRSARAALGLAEDTLHVATFGIVDRRTKAADVIVGAAGWLSTWSVPVHLHLVGDVPPGERQVLERLVEDLEIGPQVTLHGRVSRAALEQFLLGVDVAVQLRTSAVLSLSGALMDCVAFGVPTVTTSELVQELETPPYVVPSASPGSSLLVAETVVALQDLRRRDAEAIEAERREYLSRRSVDAYARALLEGLGLDAR